MGTGGRGWVLLTSQQPRGSFLAVSGCTEALLGEWGGWKEEFKSPRISYVISHGLTTYALRLRQ